MTALVWMYRITLGLTVALLVSQVGLWIKLGDIGDQLAHVAVS